MGPDRDGTAVDAWVLGPVELRAGGRPVALSPMERSVIGLLVAGAGRSVTVNRLLDELWPGGAPPSARNRLQALVSTIRSKAGAGAVATTSTGYALGPAVGVPDLERFEELVKRARAASGGTTAAALLAGALDLWRGDAFVGCDTPGLTAEAARADELRRRATEDLFEIRLDLGEHEAVVAELSGAVATHPMRPRLRGQLMTALYRCGRDAEALETYRHGALVLADEAGIDPPEWLQRLRDAILTGQVPALPAPLGAVSDTPGAAPVPRQVPAGSARFVGRAEALAFLAGVIDADGPPRVDLISIAGMPGVGKTELARYAARLFADRFPGGSLYAELSTGTDRRTEPGGVLAAFLRAYGIPDGRVPAQLDERAALFRSIVSGRRVLVVLDNAVDEGQVRPLIPGDDGAVLITSRRAMTGLAGVRPYAIGPLDPDEGLALLAGAGGTTATPAARMVVRLCGGLPLALHVAGMRLAQDDLTVAELAARLSDERRRLDELTTADLDVRAALSVAAQTLSVPARRLLADLGRLPVRSVAPWLCAALASDPATGRAALDELHGSRLVSRAGPGRYALHDLVRLFAAETGDDDTTGPRAVDAMLTGATAAAVALPCRALPLLAPPPPDADRPDGPARDRALEWFAAEFDNLGTGVEIALAGGEFDRAGRLVNAVANYLLMRGRFEDGEALHRDVLRAASGGPALAPRIEASVRLGLATFVRMRDRWAEAAPELRRAWRLARAAGAAELMTAAALGWSVSARILGRHRVAVAAGQAASSLVSRATCGPASVGYVLTSRYQTEGRTEAALLVQSLEMFGEAGDLWGAAEVHFYLAVHHDRAGDTATALRHHELSARIYRELGDGVGTLLTALERERIRARGGDESVMPALRKLLKDARHLRHEWAEGHTLLALGQLERDRGLLADAERSIGAAVAVFGRLGAAKPLARALDELASVRAAASGPAAGRTDTVPTAC